MKKIVFIVGSLRENSFNRQMAEVAVQRLDGRVETSFLDYRDVPLMNQDIEFPTPAAVQKVRETVSSADGIWILTAEYNSSYPGVLKNLLDWLSRPLKPNDRTRTSAVTGKKVTISGASGKSATFGARAKLAELLGAMRMDLMKEPQVGIALTGDAFATDVFTICEADQERLQAQADAFVRFLAEEG